MNWEASGGTIRSCESQLLFSCRFLRLMPGLIRIGWMLEMWVGRLEGFFRNLPVIKKILDSSAFSVIRVDI